MDFVLSKCGSRPLHDAASWNLVQSRPGHFPQACRLPISDTMLHLGHPRRATGESLGPGSAWRGIPLPRTHSPAQGGGRVTELTGHESASPPGSTKARPALPRLWGPLTLQKQRPPARWDPDRPRLDAEHPPPLLSPAPSGSDTMGSARPLRLMLLSLLLVGTALGDAPQAPPGTPASPRPGDPSSPWPGGRGSADPYTRPDSCRAPQVCVSVSVRPFCGAGKLLGPNSPPPPPRGSLSRLRDAADLLWLRLPCPSCRKPRGDLPPAPGRRALPGADPQLLLRQVHAELPRVHVRRLRGQCQQFWNFGGLQRSVLEDWE